MAHIFNVPRIFWHVSCALEPNFAAWHVLTVKREIADFSYEKARRRIMAT